VHSVEKDGSGWIIRVTDHDGDSLEVMISPNWEMRVREFKTRNRAVVIDEEAFAAILRVWQRCHGG
jgi:hypothetical protein